MPKVNKKLTYADILAAKPEKKNRFLFDDDGLRVLIRPTGTKVWQYPYKFNGQNNIYTIGRFIPKDQKQGLATARKLRDEVKELLRQGIDPNRHKKALKQQKIADGDSTFQVIAEEWYAKQNWTTKHAKNIKSRLEKDVFPEFGWKAIKDVTAQDIIRILKKIEDRGSVTVAQRINQYCVEILDYAITLALCDYNPAIGRTKILKKHEKKNRAHLKEAELPAFIKALYAEDDCNLTILLVRLSMLTAQRPIEVREARWSEFDIGKAIWNIPAERMKMKREQLVPLSKQALVVIKKIEVLSGDCELLFPGFTGRRKPISDVTIIKTVKRLCNGKMTPHGIRHTASTILREHNFDKDWVELQLSHSKEHTVEGTYNKAQYIEQRYQMMQWWANYLEEMAQ